jgi:hypothetical protein
MAIGSGDTPPHCTLQPLLNSCSNALSRENLCEESNRDWSFNHQKQSIASANCRTKEVGLRRFGVLFHGEYEH